MSTPINKTRRNLIKGSVLTLLTILVNPKVFADDLTDLVTRDNKNQIIAVRLWPSSVYTRLTMESENELDAIYNITANHKLSIIIKNANLNAILQKLNDKVLTDDPIIKNIQVKQNSNDINVIITLKQDTSVQTRHIPPVSLDEITYKYRYVIDLYPNRNKNSTTGTDDNELNDDLLAVLQLNPDPIDKFVIESPVQESPIAKSQHHVSNRDLAIPVFKKIPIIPPKGKILIVLDPGHGGEDPGAIGPTGTKEKHVVLDIAKRLQDLINQTDYMVAKLTRNDDIFIPLGARVAIARRARADMFISIHADAFTTPFAKGSSAFVLSDSGATSTFARWLAKTQNNSDLIGGVTFKTNDKSLNKVLLDMTQSWSLNKSSKLARILLTNLSHIAKLHNGHVEKAGFAVLKAPDIPSVLVETAFISNPLEEALLKTPEFRQKMAENLLGGLSNFAKNILYA